MDYLGLAIELLFLAFGVYLYLFALGKLKFGKPDVQAQADTFRARNAWWMRLGGLAIVAIMLVNIYLHLLELFGK